MNLMMTVLALVIVIPGLAVWGHGDKPVRRLYPRRGWLQELWHFSSLRRFCAENIAHFVYFCNIDRISYGH